MTLSYDVAFTGATDKINQSTASLFRWHMAAHWEDDTTSRSLTATANKQITHSAHQQSKVWEKTPEEAFPGLNLYIETVVKLLQANIHLMQHPSAVSWKLPL